MGASGRKRDRRKTVRALFPDDVLVQPLVALTKEAAIAELLNALAVAGRIPMQREKEVLDAILERERVATTGIGNGLAIPHGKTRWADRMGIAVGVSHQGLDFAARDGEPARVVVLTVSPPTATAEHLAVMRALATVAKEPKSVNRIAGIRDRRELLDFLETLELTP